MKDITGYLLHPSIQFEKEESRIAEVGIGTAIWLLELADELPSSARLDGFDISAEQYPPQAWVSPNVHLSTQDSFKPFPEKYLGKYDVVNLKFALCYVNNMDAEPLLENLISLLKPGGFLQWMEPQRYRAQVKAFGTPKSTAAVEQLVKILHKPKPDNTFDWVEDLPMLYEKYGLEKVESQQLLLKDRHRLPWAHGQLLSLQDLIKNSGVAGTEKAEGLQKLIAALNEEFSRGVSVGSDVNYPIGDSAIGFI